MNVEVAIPDCLAGLTVEVQLHVGFEAFEEITRGHEPTVFPESCGGFRTVHLTLPTGQRATVFGPLERVEKDPLAVVVAS